MPMDLSKKISDVMNQKLEKRFAVSEGPILKGVEAIHAQYTTPAVPRWRINLLVIMYTVLMVSKKRTALLAYMQRYIFSHRLNTQMH